MKSDGYLGSDGCIIFNDWFLVIVKMPIEFGMSMFSVSVRLPMLFSLVGLVWSLAYRANKHGTFVPKLGAMFAVRFTS